MSRAGWDADTVAIGRGKGEGAKGADASNGDGGRETAGSPSAAPAPPAESIGTDTVAIGKGRASDTAARRPARGQGAPRLKASAPVSRRVLGSAVLAAIVVALVAVLTSGSSEPEAPIREAADPAPRSTVERPHKLPSRRLPTQGRRREARPAPDTALKRQPKGKLERRGREPVEATAPSPELAETAEPEPEYVPPPEPEYVPPPETPAAPTPPGNEFGL